VAGKLRWIYPERKNMNTKKILGITMFSIPIISAAGAFIWATGLTGLLFGAIVMACMVVFGIKLMCE
jgi:hypothetical protein